MWSYVTHGEGEVWIHEPDTGIAVEEGNLILFPRGAIHSFRGTALCMQNVHFDATIYGCVDFLSMVGQYGVFQDEDGLLGKLNDRLCRLHARKPPGWQAAGESCIRLIVSDLVQQYPDRLSLQVRDCSALNRILPVLDFLEERFNDPELRVADLALEAGVSEVRLRSLFRQATGVSPMTFLQHRRLEHACRRLKQGNAAIHEIASESGFESKQFFYRVFRRRFGMTPQTYRNESAW